MTHRPLKYRLLDRKTLYRGFFRMELYTVSYDGYDGAEIGPVAREIFERGDAAALVPYDPVRDEVVFIEQFRPGALREENGPWLTEFVAGIVDPGDRGDPLAAVLREAGEEAGLECRFAIRAASFYTTPGGSTEKIDLYVGCVDASRAGGVHGLASEHESIRVFAVPFAEALGMLRAGELRNAATIIGMQHLALNRAEIRAEFLGRLRGARGDAGEGSAPPPAPSGQIY